MKQGFIQIYTGDGKGKTTAAIGQAVRAAGQGLRVVIVQFFKNDESGEIRFCENNPQFRVFRFNSQKKAPWCMDDRELARLSEDTRAGFDFVLRLLAEDSADLVVLDEIIIAVDKGLLNDDDIRALLASRTGPTEIIMTGRGASSRLIALADLVTEMKKIKHPFDQGVPARKGIEF